MSLAGIERTVASQVVGPFLLTELLLDRLRATGLGRVITMTSGGMYAADLTVEQLEMGEGCGGVVGIDGPVAVEGFGEARDQRLDLTGERGAC